MQTSFVVSKTKRVYLATDAPDEVIRMAQVAVVTRNTWHVLGPQRAHGELAFADMPAVTCPIVDISPLPESLDSDVNTILSQHIVKTGVLDVEAMISELHELGAVIMRPVQEMDPK